MKLTVEQGWRKGDLKQLVKHLHPRDREEVRFITGNLEIHIKEVLEEMGDHCTSVHDERGRLWWLGGVSPSYEEGHEKKGYAWLLKTKFAKPKFKKEKAIMRTALEQVLQLAKDKTHYETIGNIIWNQQKVNLRWLESAGFMINYKGYGTITRTNGVQGTFYQFAKEIRRDNDGN